MCETLVEASYSAHSRHRPSIFIKFRLALEARRQRRALARLDADRLRDVGLTENDAISEVSKPFWDVPDYWCK